MKSSIFP